MPENEILDSDFIIGVVWNDLLEQPEPEVPDVIVERSRFKSELTAEEINILALLMK